MEGEFSTYLRMVRTRNPLLQFSRVRAQLDIATSSPPVQIHELVLVDALRQPRVFPRMIRAGVR